MKKILFLVILSIPFCILSQTSHDIWMQSKMNGVLEMDGGGTTEFWGYSTYSPPTPGSKVFLPGPLLRFNEGDTVRVHFLNNSPEDHTIHWHGLDVDYLNDGVPNTSTEVEPDSIHLYTFVCAHAGTFNYHCHVMTSLHLAMGMYGLFVVDPDSARNRIYTNGPRYTKDYNWLASELNQNWNDNVLSPGLFTLYEPTYFMLNGLSGAQLQTGDFDVNGSINDTIALRLGNMGYGMVRYIFPPEANMRIYMSDGRPLPNMIESDTIEVFSGERFTVVLYPTEEFTSQVELQYIDLRTNQHVGTNTVPMEISLVSTAEIEKEMPFELLGNPIDEVLVIKCKDDQIKQLNIVSLNGEFVNVLNIKKGTNFYPINLKPGQYFLIDETSSTSLSFVKM